MTPGARVQAAIEVLDKVLADAPAEQVLTRWARASRFAGSKDRAAVRGYVFDALRQLRSAAWAGGAGDVPLSQMTGRAVMIGLLRNHGVPLDQIFTGQGHAPAPLAPSEALGGDVPMPAAVALDCPDWLMPLAHAALGADTEAVLTALRHRAPTILRCNLRKTSRTVVQRDLAALGFETEPHSAAPTALTVLSNARGLDRTEPFLAGAFEFQDAGSQAVVEALPVEPGQRILDLCAGGGGKALALAVRADVQVFAHDADPARLSDLPARAARAGTPIPCLERPEGAAPFDGVITDVPCSGSGAWRRSPEAKWRLTPARLDHLRQTQAEILDRAIGLLRPGGWVAYLTCALWNEENGAQIEGALARHPDLIPGPQMRLTPLDGCDGFYFALLTKPKRPQPSV